MPSTNHSASERTPTAVNPPSNRPISPAARKFAEYLARRLAPMIEYAAKQQQQHASGENGSNIGRTTIDEEDIGTGR